MTVNVNIHEAKTHLSRLLEQVAAGERVVISKAGTPIADLVPHQACWYAGGDVWQSIYGLPLRLADSARRFDTSPAWFSHVGAASVLPWLAGLDRAAVRAHCEKNRSISSDASGPAGSV